MSTSMVSRIEGQTLILERVFQAPRELVFQVFSEAEHLKHWWGPRGWELTICNVDFRPGGIWHYCMKCVDEGQGDFFGYESWGKGIYQEIVQAEKIDYTDYFSDAEGTVNADLPATKVSMLFLEHDGQTKLVSRSEYDSKEALQQVIDMGMEQGITETWDRLSEYLAAKQG
ncbi:SRPBCC domain-containing protein [Paenibacillus sp. GCM10023252]|uniref:SRPBCC domain-containing protein n=1 Tax=Paenibacillus sp. GCM10023252 TaxID=3252649 RepID=UPI00360D7FB0